MAGKAKSIPKNQPIMNSTQTFEENQITPPVKILYTGKTRTIGGRDGGSVQSDDGRLNVKLSIPGSPGAGTNPEQLFAAGWSACFIGAMKIAAGKMKVRIPPDAAIDAEVDLCLAEAGYFLQARLNVALPGLDHEVVRALVKAAHQTCPYSKATRGNLNVTINIIPADSATRLDSTGTLPA